MLVDVIIPTYKPDEKLIEIVKSLLNQSVRPHRIVLMNTEQKYIENLLRGRNYDLIEKHLDIKHVSAWEFDHGATRNLGAMGSEADYLLYLTMDAVPVDYDLIEKLIEGFKADEKIAVCYARQLASEDAKLSEQFSRLFNYPDQPVIKSADDVERLGIKTYFCSNACAMYKREVFEELGMFPKDMIFNEDMVFAHKVIHSGYKIAYVPEAMVYHSHNYTNMQQFHRNFDLGVSQAMHPEVFENVSSEAEGSSYVKEALKYFKSRKRPLYFIPFGVTCVYRLVGFKLGKNYEKLSRKRILKCTMSPKYFKKHWR